MFPLHISYFENVLMQIFQILSLVSGTMYSKTPNTLKLDHTHIKVIYFHFIPWMDSESIFGNSAFHIKVNLTQLLHNIIKYKVLCYFPSATFRCPKLYKNRRDWFSKQCIFSLHSEYRDFVTFHHFWLKSAAVHPTLLKTIQYTHVKHV